MFLSQHLLFINNTKKKYVNIYTIDTYKCSRPLMNLQTIFELLRKFVHIISMIFIINMFAFVMPYLQQLLINPNISFLFLYKYIQCTGIYCHTIRVLLNSFNSSEFIMFAIHSMDIDFQSDNLCSFHFLLLIFSMKIFLLLEILW